MILRLHTERYLKYFWAFLGGAINSFLHLIRKLRQMDFAEVLICCYPYLLAASGRTVFPGQGSEMLISEKHSGIFLFFSLLKRGHAVSACCHGWTLHPDVGNHLLLIISLLGLTRMNFGFCCLWVFKMRVLVTTVSGLKYLGECC